MSKARFAASIAAASGFSAFFGKDTCRKKSILSWASIRGSVEVAWGT
jgi:hypothetical protein